MKFRRRNDLEGREGTRPGFTQNDIIYLRRETHTPKTQIFSTEELEDPPKERVYHCAICKGPLSYQRKLEIWKCDECQDFYDTKIQDVPVKNTNEFKVTPWSELMHYPTADAEDLPFLEVISLDRDEENETRTYEDKRVQHINLHNVTFADAILAGALSSKKQAQQEDG